jgi:hypothetical protein
MGMPVASVVPKDHDRHDSGSNGLKGDEEDVDARRTYQVLRLMLSEIAGMAINTNIYQTRGHRGV